MQVQSISAGKSEPSKITICPAAKNSVPEKMEKRRPPIDENKVEMPPVFPPIDTTALLAGRWNIPHLDVVLPHCSPGSGPGQALRRTIVRLIRGSSDAPTSSMGQA